MLKQGLYEQLINRMIGREIKQAEEENMYVDVAPIDTGEASKVLSQYLAEIIEKGLDNVRDNGEVLPIRLHWPISSWMRLRQRRAKARLMSW